MLAKHAREQVGAWCPACSLSRALLSCFGLILLVPAPHAGCGSPCALRCLRSVTSHGLDAPAVLQEHTCDL